MQTIRERNAIQRKSMKITAIEIKKVPVKQRT